MSCAFHRGQFIAWGGSSGDKRDITMHNNIPIVYNVARDEWVQNYTSDPSASPSVDPTHGDDKTNLGPIIGGAVGGVVVLIGCIAAFIIIRRKKRAAKKDPVSNGDKVGGSGGAGGGKHSSSNDDYDDGLGYIAGPRTGNRQQQRYTNVNMVDDSEPEAHHYPDNRYSMGPMVQTSNHLAATNGLGGVGQDPYYAVEPGVGAIAGAGAGAMYGHPLPGEHPLPGGANTMSGYWDPLAGYMDPAAARPLSGAGMPLEENAYSPQTFVDPYKIPPPAGYEAPPDIGAKVIPWPPVQYQGAQYQEQQQYSPQHLQFQQQQYSPQYSPAQQQEKLAYHDQYSQRSSYAPPLSPPASTSSANSPYPYKTPYDDMSPKSSKDQRLSMQNTNRLSGPQSIRDSSGSAFSDSKSARAPQVLHPVGEDLGYVAPPK
ncbi:hypothetical protein BX616_008878 [Lobosporangium transversale]|nr:hypothetical protein BX616_008878 [Lobosporangium transversale]